eukprot:6209671-Pyramimonas_sp.AAC.1
MERKGGGNAGGHSSTDTATADSAAGQRRQGRARETGGAAGRQGNRSRACECQDVMHLYAAS